MMRHQFVTVLLAAVILSGAARVQGSGCDTVVSRTTLSALSGRRFGSVRVVTLPPVPLPGPAGHLSRLHVRTREKTVRRQPLLAAGDSVDTLRVAESLRRLRCHRYLTDVVIEGTSSDATSPVELTVTTRDGWSTNPSLRVRSNSSTAVGVTERNLFGTGWEATLSIGSEAGRVGIGAALASVDPTLESLPERGRLAETALAVSLDRYINFVDLSRSWGLDGAVFSASLGARGRLV